MAKSTTEDLLKLDARFMQRNGYLVCGASGSLTWSRRGKEIGNINYSTTDSTVILSYKTRSNDSEWMDQNYSVQIERTACNYGGSRSWFRCPNVFCKRRVAILYGGSVFTCRKCQNLNYPSQQESWIDRPCSQADKIRERLKWQAGIANGKGIKPKGMHQTTYIRLVRRHDRLVMQTCANVRNRFGSAAVAAFQEE